MPFLVKQKEDNMKTRKAIFLGLTLFLIASFILPVSCAQEATASTEFKTFSKYGFSFEYPERFPVLEGGMLGNEANDMGNPN